MCSWVALCLAVYRCPRSGVDGSVLGKNAPSNFVFCFPVVELK